MCKKPWYRGIIPNGVRPRSEKRDVPCSWPTHGGLSDMPLTGEAKREYMRERRRRVAAAKRALIQQATDTRPPGAPIKHEVAAVNLARAELRSLLATHDLGVSRLLTKVGQRLESGRLVITSEGAGRDRVSHTVTTHDNQAQLRATEILIGLLEAAGELPSRGSAPSSGGLHLSVKVLMLGDSNNGKGLQVRKGSLVDGQEVEVSRE